MCHVTTKQRIIYFINNIPSVISRTPWYGLKTNASESPTLHAQAAYCRSGAPVSSRVAPLSGQTTTTQSVVRAPASCTINWWPAWKERRRQWKMSCTQYYTNARVFGKKFQAKFNFYDRFLKINRKIYYTI